jgi:dynein regulatory complex protein 1
MSKAAKKPENESFPPRFGDIKIDEARGVLEQLRRQTDEMIEKVRLETNFKENQRRVLEEKKRTERTAKLENEVLISHKKNVEIDWNWQELEEKEDCKELAEDIEEQVKNCKKIIDDKNELIGEFQNAITSKDKSYVELIDRMDENIDSLIGNMKIQFTHLRHDYGFQLLSIEDEFERERSELLKHNLEEVEALFKKHRETEKDFSEQKMNKQKEYAEKIEILRSTDANVNSE